MRAEAAINFSGNVKLLCASKCRAMLWNFAFIHFINTSNTCINSIFELESLIQLRGI